MRNLIWYALVTTTALAMSASISLADLKIGIAAEPFPPFSQKAADGSWEGWEIDIIEAICEAMDEECELVPVAWEGIIPALNAKKVDAIMAAMAITNERKKVIDFSNKYFDIPAVLVGRIGENMDGTGKSLAGKRIGVQVSSVHAKYAETYFGDATIKTYSTFDEHNQDLAAGRLDAVIGGSLVFEEFLASQGGSCCEIKSRFLNPEIFGQGVGAGLRKGEEALQKRFNAAIAKIREDGTYAKISETYFRFDIFGE